MSEPAVFALIRNGEKRFFADRWASALLRREVLWGPEDFESWVSQFEELDEWDDYCDDGAVVDFDKKTLVWSGDLTPYNVPCLMLVYRKLLLAAWPGFEVRIAERVDELTHSLVIQSKTDEHEEEEQPWDYRPENVSEAMRDDTEEDDDCEVGDEEADDLRAWITLVDTDGSMRHRELSELPIDVLQCKPNGLKALLDLSPAQIPKEEVVSEGIWINASQKAAAIWGSESLLLAMKKLGKDWKGWKIKWLKKGYTDHCALSKTQGLPMSTEAALAKILPLILSKEQFNMQAVMGAIGGGVKKYAVKATGCLLAILCLPLILFGIFSGN